MSDVESLYHAAIVDHDRHPRNHRALDGATHAKTVDNPLCGDVVTLQLRVVDGVIREAAFEGRGCALSRAAASILTTMLRDRPVEEARELGASFEAFACSAPEAAVPDELGELAAFGAVRRFRSRRLCATLAVRAMIEALDR